MGYRSDVRILTTKKGFKELKKFTDNYLKEKNYTYGNLLDDCKMIHRTDLQELVKVMMIMKNFLMKVILKRNKI